MLDVAGEVLRRNRLIWAETAPLMRTIDDDEDAALLYQLYVPFSADRAFALTEEVFELLIDRDLATPGLSFTFLSNQG